MSAAAPIAIVAAMHEELAAVLDLMPDERKVVVAGREFWQGHLHGHEVVAVLARIGKVAAATTATVLAERFEVGRVVFTGVAGGLGHGVQVGDVVVASEFLQHDMDASPIFPRYELPLYGRSLIACDAALSALLFEAASACLARTGAGFDASSDVPAHRVHRGLIASGDRFVSAAGESAALRSALQLAGHEALAVEMEGAAVAQVCLDYGVPFAAVRTISDRADDQAHVDFGKFVREVASLYAEHVLQALLEKL